MYVAALRQSLRFRTHLQTGDDTFVLNTIRTVFSTADMLGASFKSDAIACAGAYDHGLDLDDIRSSYRLIMKQEPQVRFF
jgi:hypothetical protein